MNTQKSHTDGWRQDKLMELTSKGLKANSYQLNTKVMVTPAICSEADWSPGTLLPLVWLIYVGANTVWDLRCGPRKPNADLLDRSELRSGSLLVRASASTITGTTLGIISFSFLGNNSELLCVVPSVQEKQLSLKQKLFTGLSLKCKMSFTKLCRPLKSVDIHSQATTLKQPEDPDHPRVVASSPKLWQIDSL